MPLRSGRSRGTGRGRPVRRLGAVRRSQLITTYGVGSMVAVEDQSFIVSGLDSWAVGNTPDLREFRLQTRLGVSGFNLPPASDPPGDDGVRVRRFPELYTCPGPDPISKTGCEHNLKRYKDFNPPANRSECAACGGQLTPSRFVVACPNGHLDDFPYWEWVHVGRSGGDGGNDHRLSFRTTGRTASLRSVVISCRCGKQASMEGAFDAGALASIRYSCKGGRPWLGRDARAQGCTESPRTLQRGSSAAWFPVVRSALSIPPFSQPLHDEIFPYYSIWKGEDDDVIARQAQKEGIAPDRFSVGDVIRAIRDHEAYEAGERSDPTVLTGFEAADVLREEEYRQLCQGAATSHFECAAPNSSGESTPRGIGQTMLVKRLREVRALQTFTRVQAPMPGDGNERLAELSSGDVGWLPAIEVVGEGVFVKLDGKRLRSWEAPDGRGSPEARARRIRGYHQELLAKRAGAADRNVPDSPVTARLIVVHTLSHALINEWSLDAGYPAASLRERLYVLDDMAGVLIYTATSDSAGSLGGLVSRGEPRYLADALEAALQRMRWCSADPLCMESDASGADSLNLAACHACMLVPETSCETNNSFLDRALLVGTPDGTVAGYFE